MKNMVTEVLKLVFTTKKSNYRKMSKRTLFLIAVSKVLNFKSLYKLYKQ